MTAISFFLFIIQICAQFAPSETPAALNIKSCQVFFQSLKMSFRIAEAASCALYWGIILIYNFAMEANRHGRYHRRQPPENKLTFFPPFSPLHPARWAAFLKWCAGLLALMWAVSQISEGWGIDGGDDEEILMHIYQLIKGQSQQASPPLPHSPSLSTSLTLPLEISPLLFSHRRLLCSLSFMPWLHLPLLQPHRLALSYLQLRSSAGRGGGGRGCRLTPLQFDRDVAPSEQLEN